MKERGNTGKGREMTGKIGWRGLLNKMSIIYCGFDTSCKQLQLLWILAPSIFTRTHCFCLHSTRTTSKTSRKIKLLACGECVSHPPFASQ